VFFYKPLPTLLAGDFVFIKMIIFTAKTYTVIQDCDAFWVFNKSLCQRADNRTLTCFPRIETICEDTKDHKGKKFGRAKVIKALDYLEEVGIIKIYAQVINKATGAITQHPRGYKIQKGMNNLEYTSSLYEIIAGEDIVSITGRLKTDNSHQGSVPELGGRQFQNRTEVPPKIELTSVPKSYSNLQDHITNRNTKRTKKREKITGKSEEKEDDNIPDWVKKEAQEIIIHHNGEYPKSIERSYKSWIKNFEYWRETYSLIEIKNAITNIRQDEYWRDKMTLTILFRKRNRSGEDVDYINMLLRKMTPEQLADYYNSTSAPAVSQSPSIIYHPAQPEEEMSDDDVIAALEALANNNSNNLN
jgi:hypothetical protein